VEIRFSAAATSRGPRRKCDVEVIGLRFMRAFRSARASHSGRYNGDPTMAAIVTRKRFTAEEYQRMGQAGILTEDDRVELIDGEIVAMTPIGTRHNASVNRGTRALVRAAGDDAIVQSQGSIRLDSYSEPEPDLVLLRPRSDFYASRHAGPADTLLIIEVAQSSIEYDRDVKAPLYAAAGIPEYWLVDLNTNLLSRYSSPERGVYRGVEQYRRGQSIAPQLVPTCLIAVDELLTD
jgi:Uma2 family endonuclease